MTSAYGMAEYGYYLTREELKRIAAKCGIDPSESTDYIASEIDVEYSDCFTGTVVPVDDNGNPVWRYEIHCVGDPIYYFPLTGYPNLFRHPYVSMQDVVNELRRCYGKYLPDSDDAIAKGVCYIVGVYYG